MQGMRIIRSYWSAIASAIHSFAIVPIDSYKILIRIII